MLEVQDVPDVRTPPSIDRLIVVSDDHEILVLTREQLDEAELRPIRVLVLVDQQEGEALAISLEQVGIRLEELHRPHEEVVEIEGVLMRQRLFVLRVDLGDVAHEEVERAFVVAGERRRVDELVLRGADLVSDALGAPPFRIEPDRLLHGLHVSERLLRIEDREGPVPAEPVGVPAEKTGADRMEGPDPHARGLRPQESPDPLTHLARCLVRERDRKDPFGRHAVLVNQMANAGREHPCLARAGARENENRSLDVLGCLQLLIIQTGEVWGHVGSRHVRA